MMSRNKWKLLNIGLFVVVIVILTLFVRAESERRATVKELEEVSKSTQESGEERAARVLEAVQKHMKIITDPEPTVATIVDIERLREASSFYEAAENGDHLIITKNRAILYDPDNDIIIDTVPILAQPSITPESGSAAPQSTSSASDTSPLPSSSEEPTAIE